ncbi:T9SS type B sorting domain-containing protein [Flavobacterium humi]|uniref:T9SS type B sorting domain-containing protein n=1 Tax=Flavobacterium humi TaxID=2562683 RepID=A0A4Z0L6B0_9FLAO|nr:choice-of-anchor L domain-containing protein [Flavobacterium humi]TGD57937.1 T9SS type B sorting domain-containing protein [Flavobacterium humi]
MKRILFFFILATSLPMLSQSITINSTAYSEDELVKDVLVNSPCVNARDVSFRTGTNFGSSNGIGYFENTNPNFPLQNGVILTTGNIFNSQGPNTSELSDGSMAWDGDADLEAALLASGITLNSKNATVLEFNFTALSPNFNFQFLFASEEYGAYQCLFEDAFAFLLTDSTNGTTQNIAVVPSTSTPISVRTIRNITYNSGCPSANPQYFGRYNGGAAATTSATNFNGQTVLMNASSTLVPNRTYHIKLVIADRGDNEFDSAVFLGGGSFDFGEDILGPDLTIANNTALCDGDTYTITSGLDPNLFDFVWKDEFGNPLPGETGPNLTISSPGTYQLTYYVQSSLCEVATNDIVIEYNATLTTPNPQFLYKCDSGQANYTFNLAYNNLIVDPTSSNQVSYHELQSEAESNTNPLPLSYTVSAGSLPKTIWVRIQNPAGCHAVKSFELQLVPPPAPAPAWSFSMCESVTGGGTASFDLPTQDPTALNGSSGMIFNVTYYTSLSDANAGINNINTTSFFVSGSTVIYVRVQNKTDPGCATVSSLNLVAVPNPMIPQIADQYVCTSYTLGHLTQGNYFTGANGTGTPLFEGDVITTEQHIYVYYETGGIPSCNSESDFFVWLVDPSDLSPGDTQCDQFILPPAPIPGSQYFTQAGGPSTPGNTELLPGYVAAVGEVIHVYFVSMETPPCILESSFTVHVDITPTITGTFPDLFDCNPINSLPALSVGNYYTQDILGTYHLLTFPINTTTDIYVFAENNNCRTPIIHFTAYIDHIPMPNRDVCTSYVLTAPPIGEYRDAPNGGGNIIPPGIITAPVGSNTRTIYFHVASANCTDDDSFVVTFHKPIIADQPDYTNCGNFVLPINPDGADYYTLSGGPSVTGNVKLIPNVSFVATSATIYLYKESTALTGCFTEKPWRININTKPVIDGSADQVVCYNYTLLPLTNGNYYDDPMGVNPITDLFIDITDLNANDDLANRTKIIYIYAENPNDPANCYTQSMFKIAIDGIEAVDLGNQTACDTYTLPVLPPQNHYYTLSGGPTTPGNVELITASQRTFTSSTTSPIYIYRETSNHLNCQDENLVNIIINHSTTAFSPTAISECDTFAANDGIFSFDLTQRESEVLGTQTPASDYSFSYYTSLADANNPLATPIANPSAYQNDNPFNDSVWVRIINNNNIPANSCFGVAELSLIVKPLPNPVLQPEYSICTDYETGALVNPVLLEPGVAAANHTFEWTLAPSPTIISTSPTHIAAIDGTYSVKVTDVTTGCSKTITTTVTEYAPYIEIVYSDAFESPSYITINVLGSGSGNYEYQLDEADFQDSNVFYDVAPGEHTVTVRDKDGQCSPAPATAIIINYPKFFTPNGDGYHETWNIPNLRPSNPDAPIFIFDRFGKLIKQITPSSGGWDGTFNGKPLPATDYWFAVHYLEKGTSKTFKAHFTLKR